MRKFIINSGFFLGIILIVWVGIEIFYRTVPNNYSVKNKYIKNAYNDAEVLIMGNSHAFYGLNPDFFSIKSFNLSNISQTVFYDKLLFDKHVDSFKKLDYLILPIEYTTFTHRDDHADLKWRSYFYEAQMGVDTQFISRFNIKRYSLALVPRFRLTVNSISKYLSDGIIADCSTNGFGKYHGVNEVYNSATAGIAKLKSHEDGSLNFNRNRKIVKDIIQKCKEKQIKVIIINMPVTSYYADNVSTVKRKKIINECKQLCVPEKVFYLNLFQDGRFNNNDFYDVDHLNVEGAKKCSKIVSDFIDEKTY